MAVKRRIVWFSDEDWAILQQVAKDRGATISAVLRDFWRVAAEPDRVEHRRVVKE